MVSPHQAALSGRIMDMRCSRRDLLSRLGGAAGIAALASRRASEQEHAAQASPRSAPPSVLSTPPRDFTPVAPPVTYPDPDVLTIDPSFNALRLRNTPIQRLWTG